MEVNTEEKSAKLLDVHKSLQDLEAEVEIIDNITAELASRLEFVSRSIDKKEAVLPCDEKSSTNPLSQRLEQTISRLRKIKTRLQPMLKNLEI